MLKSHCWQRFWANSTTIRYSVCEVKRFPTVQTARKENIRGTCSLATYYLLNGKASGERNSIFVNTPYCIICHEMGKRRQFHTDIVTLKISRRFRVQLLPKIHFKGFHGKAPTFAVKTRWAKHPTPFVFHHLFLRCLVCVICLCKYIWNYDWASAPSFWHGRPESNLTR